MTEENTKYPLVRRLRTMAAIGWNPIGDEAADEIERLQCKIDALMLEYCPDEMTEEQKVEWARHQRPVSDQRREAARRITIQG